MTSDSRNDEVRNHKPDSDVKYHNITFIPVLFDLDQIAGK